MRRLAAMTLAGVLGWSALGVDVARADADRSEQPPNSSHLAENGLSPRLFDVLISPMYQEQTVLRARTQVVEVQPNATRRSEFEILYDPFDDYGLRLTAIIRDGESYEHWSKRDIKRFLGRTYEKYRSMRHQSALQEEDVTLMRRQGDTVVLGFRFPNSALPGNISYLQHMQGEVVLIDGVLDRVVLSMTEPRKVKGVDATEWSFTTTFHRLPEGGYLLQRSEEFLKGTKGKEAYEFREVFEVLDYHDAEGRVIASYPRVVDPDWRSDGTLDTLSVSLERSLPFLGNAARKAGYELPLPWGVDIFTHFQREDLGLEKIVVNGADLSSLALVPGGSKARAITNLMAVRGDVWLLPFLNVTVMTGYILGTTEVTLGLTPEAQLILGLDTDKLIVNTDVTGPLIGGGATAAGGYKKFFATVNAMFIHQFVNEANTSVDALAVTTLVGVRLPRIINIVTGPQYQLYNSDIAGSVNLEGGTLDYSVQLKATRWNWLVGLQRDFSNRYNGTVMVGFEPRPQATIVLGYRF